MFNITRETKRDTFNRCKSQGCGYQFVLHTHFDHMRAKNKRRKKGFTSIYFLFILFFYSFFHTMEIHILHTHTHTHTCKYLLRKQRIKIGKVNALKPQCYEPIFLLFYLLVPILSFFCVFFLNDEIMLFVCISCLCMCVYICPLFT